MGEVTYLVGGAVRDDLLGLPIKERDWVVTGSTPETLIARGFRQVGADFPVFLHPRTSEEYALARTERKQGQGYHGFSVEFDPTITIEQDLERRDLTINAMARDESGALVDPFGGQQDLQDRLLRHVSPAFSEDPLRVLRVARFAARFQPLGFRVHPDTLALMRSMAEAGELDHLVPERVWTEVVKAMGSRHPAEFLRVLRSSEALLPLFPELDGLFGVPQNPEYHPEIDCGEHLLLALDVAADLVTGADVAPLKAEDVVIAVLLHDLGKALTPRERWPAHHGHEKSGVPLVAAVCDRYRVPNRTRRLALQVCEYHLLAHRALELRPGKVLTLLEQLGALRQGGLEAFILACEADYRGRAGLQDRPYPQGDRLRRCLEAVETIRAADVVGPGVSGPQVGEALRNARLEALRELTVNEGE